MAVFDGRVDLDGDGNPTESNDAASDGTSQAGVRIMPAKGGATGRFAIKWGGFAGRHNLETGTVTLYVSRVSKHARMTYVLFVLPLVFLPLGHVKKSTGKLLASDSLDHFFAAVTDEFDRFDSRVRRKFSCHTLSRGA